MPTVIDVDAPLVTLVNVFTVAPDRQEELIQALSRATTEVMRGIPGFVSANLHASLDGTAVVNYAQWASEQDFQAMFEYPGVKEHMAEITAIIEKFEPRLYTVRETFQS